ncbi:hypothetical protein AZI86_10800 [Bdellovibrio bacteriovorus]|uniref:Uncharacterized protein n=1 Tax=Bdellovibrio bacteriovorus TaxID=959 RepID=A0A150WL17_BDEBC|nr:hypothetical protein [Bdellovibrio bacteriovorus]KYG64691.1 hypothetical protein AZI86_10800 [Bdellovibrio bacteriovorus]
MKKITFILFLIFLGTVSAQGQTKKSLPVWCDTKVWPYDRDMPLSDIVRELNTMDRVQMVQMIWGELLLRHSKPMAVPLIAYVAGSAIDDDLNGYFKALAYLNLKGVQVQQAIQKWPLSRKVIEPVMSLEQMCSLFEKSQGPKWLTVGTFDKSPARKPAKVGGKNAKKKK